MVDIVHTAPGARTEKPTSQEVVGGTDEAEGTASDRVFVPNDGGYSNGCCYEGSNTGSAFGQAD